MSYAIATSSFNHYQKFPTSENANASLRILTNLLSDVILLIKENGGDCDVLKESMIEIAIKAASSARYNIRTEYTKEEFPSKYDWDKYRKATSSVLEIF